MLSRRSSSYSGIMTEVFALACVSVYACYKSGGTFMMDKDKCPYCGAETRPGDNFCLNCGNRLSATPSNAPQQAQPGDEATSSAPGEWEGTADAPPASSDGWADEAGATIAEPSSDHPYSQAQTAQPYNNNIEQPARFILR